MTAGLVLRCRDVEASRAFYERSLGVVFRREQHGRGPVHYSAEAGTFVIELYPAEARHPAGDTELMCPDPDADQCVTAILRDPDGRRVLHVGARPLRKPSPDPGGTRPAPGPSVRTIFRAHVEFAAAISGWGTVVGVRILDGNVRVGDRLSVELKDGRRHVFSAQGVEFINRIEAPADALVGLLFAGVDPQDVSVGSDICSAEDS